MDYGFKEGCLAGVVVLGLFFPYVEEEGLAIVAASDKVLEHHTTVE